jgi:hypothetical protein
MLKISDVILWTGFIWHRLWSNSVLLWARQWTFGFHKTQDLSWTAKPLLTYQEWFCSMELVIVIITVVKPNLRF